MNPTSILSASVFDLTPTGPVALATPLSVAIIIAMAVAVVAIVLVVILSRPRRVTHAAVHHGAHGETASADRWRTLINDVVDRYHAGTLDRESAFVELARLTRRFATQATGERLDASTLRDLSMLPRTPGNRAGLDLLRQTIEALYPAEFADASRDAHAGAIDVDEAAGWVSNLVERWRR